MKDKAIETKSADKRSQLPEERVSGNEEPAILGIVINVLPIRETSKIKRSLHHALPTLPIREREEKWARP